MAAAELVPGAVRRWPRRLIIGTCVFVSVALVAAGGGYLYFRWRLGQIHRVKLPGLADDKARKGCEEAWEVSGRGLA